MNANDVSQLARFAVTASRVPAVAAHSKNLTPTSLRLVTSTHSSKRDEALISLPARDP